MTFYKIRHEMVARNISKYYRKYFKKCLNNYSVLISEDAETIRLQHRGIGEPYDFRLDQPYGRKVNHGYEFNQSLKNSDVWQAIFDFVDETN